MDLGRIIERETRYKEQTAAVICPHGWHMVASRRDQYSGLLIDSKSLKMKKLGSIIFTNLYSSCIGETIFVCIARISESQFSFWVVQPSGSTIGDEIQMWKRNGRAGAPECHSSMHLCAS
jgi:hypothetical protein